MDNEKKQRVWSGEVVEDLILEIVCRVAEVKSVLRLRCVSKSWRALIDSKYFIDKHLQHARRRKTAHERVVFTHRKSVRERCSVRWCYWDESSPIPMDMDPSHAHLAMEHVIGHSNGILCILNGREGRIFLWNPATRISVELPQLEHKKIAKCGFGWDEESCAYKVFVGLCDDGAQIIIGAQVYSSHTNCWKQVGAHGSDTYIHGIGAFSGGKIHWLVPTGPGFGVCLESFDLKTNTFARTELPCIGGPLVCFSLWERHGCLCLVRCTNHHTTRTFWVFNSHASWLQDPRYSTTFRACGTTPFPYIQTLLQLPS